jgi:hypothetical protein
MNKILYRAMVFGIAAVSGTFAIYGQDRTLSAAAGDKYVISAEAGNVNYLDGTVNIKNIEGRSGVLLKGDRLKIGEVVTTTPQSKAEILLNPGSYVRLGGNSEFSFADTDLDNLRLELRKGSAIFEVYADEDYPVTVIAPKNSFAFIDSGVYRLDVDENGVGTLEVWKGKAAVGSADGEKVKKGRTATIEDGTASIEKFDRDDKDQLEQWSKDRSKALSKITSNLQKSLRGPLLNSFGSRGFGAFGWNVYDSFGLWVFDAQFGGHCFLPFGYGWRTPYGYYLNRGLWYYNMPWYVYNPPIHPQAPPVGSPNPGNTTRNPRTRAPMNGIPNKVDRVPPFVKVGGSNDTGRRIYNDNDNSPAPMRTRTPVYIPRAPAPPSTNPANIGRKP